MRFFRWKAIIPVVLLGLLIVLGWTFFADVVVERAVERVGAEVIGAKVDLASAAVRLARGAVVLRGLQVADPDAPMRNLAEAAEIVASVSPLPLLEKKMVVDSLAMRGVRFGTPRKTSGALPERTGTSGLVARRVSEWADQIRIPSFSLAGLGQAVDVSAISVDSLRTLGQARAVGGAADSARRAWEAELRSLDPRPQIDSARALAERLKGVDLRSLGIQGARETVTSTRATVDGLNRTINRVKTFEQTVSTGVASLKSTVASLNDARQADYAYARGLVKLPSLDAPDISPALFAQVGLQYMKPLLYWLNLAEQYLPPGLDPRRRRGPERARAAGLTVEFPRSRAYPRFLLRFADADLTLGGENVAAGAYIAKIVGLTTEPALYGRPLQFVAQRTGGVAGPRTVRAFGQLDHTKLPLRDSAFVTLGGLTLPTIPLPPLNARVTLGPGVLELSLSRVGDDLVGRWYVRSTQATWERLDVSRESGVGSRGAPAKSFAEDLLWRTVSGIKDVEIEAWVRGSISRPSLAVRSNVGTEIARSLKQQVGAEVEKAERRVRAKVDSLVAEGQRQAEQRVAAVETEVLAKIADQRAQLEQVKAELEHRIRDLTPRLPGGIRLPGSQ